MTSKRAREITGLSYGGLSKAVHRGDIRVLECVKEGAGCKSYTYDAQSVYVYKSGRDFAQAYGELHNKCTDKWVAEDMRANQEEYHCKIYARG